jgi:hypothetical protein
MYKTRAVGNVSLSAQFAMIDLLLQVGYVFLVLAVISLFVCTIPILLVVLVVLLLLR